MLQLFTIEFGTEEIRHMNHVPLKKEVAAIEIYTIIISPCLV